MDEQEKLNSICISTDSNKQFKFNKMMRTDLQQLLFDTTTKDNINVAINFFLLFIYCVIKKAQFLRHYINEYSPLVLFSWWRNKIS